jgi:hypothetical protein
MTMEIPRFTDRLLAGELLESPLGAWVRYADHAAALAHTCAERDSNAEDALAVQEERDEMDERFVALKKQLTQAHLQATAALRPSEPIAWTRNGHVIEADPDHPLTPHLEVRVVFEDEVDEEMGRGGRVEELYCKLCHPSLRAGERLHGVVAFRLHVSDCRRLHPCAACGGRGTVESSSGADVPCPACYGEGADLLTEAGEVLQAVYWSWLRSAGPGDGAVADRATPTPAMTDEREARLVAEIEGLRIQRTADGRACHRERDRVEAAAARLAALLGPGQGAVEDHAEGTLEDLLAEVEHLFERYYRAWDKVKADDVKTHAALTAAGGPGGTTPDRVQAVIAERDAAREEANRLRGCLVQVAARLGFDAGASTEQVLHAVDYALAERKGAERRADDMRREVARLTGRLDCAEANRAEAQHAVKHANAHADALVARHTRELMERDRALEGALADLAMARMRVREVETACAVLGAEVERLQIAVKNNYGDGREAMLAECVAALRDRAQRYVGHAEGHDLHRAEHIESDAAYLQREVTP